MSATRYHHNQRRYRAVAGTESVIAKQSTESFTEKALLIKTLSQENQHHLKGFTAKGKTGKIIKKTCCTEVVEPF